MIPKKSKGMLVAKNKAGLKKTEIKTQVTEKMKASKEIMALYLKNVSMKKTVTARAIRRYKAVFFI